MEKIYENHWTFTNAKGGGIFATFWTVYRPGDRFFPGTAIYGSRFDTMGQAKAFAKKHPSAYSLQR